MERSASHRRALTAAAAAGLLPLLSACGPLKAKDVPFKGTWKILEENGINKQKTEITVEVTADKGRFKTVSWSEIVQPSGTIKREETAVFDGETLFTSVKTERPSIDGGSALAGDQAGTSAQQMAALAQVAQGALGAPKAEGRKPSAAELRKLRFWVNDLWLSRLSGKGSIGPVAGRDAAYYEGKEIRPDGRIDLRVWADKQNGIILKSFSSIYSTQVDSLVLRTTVECQQVEFGPVDEAAFAKL